MSFWRFSTKRRHVEYRLSSSPFASESFFFFFATKSILEIRTTLCPLNPLRIWWERLKIKTGLVNSPAHHCVQISAALLSAFCDCFLFRILHVCHGVLFKQLTAWMLRGVLIDKHNEFFVQKVLTATESASASREEDELGLADTSARQMQHLLVSVSGRHCMRAYVCAS